MEKITKIDPQVKTIINLLGVGTLLAASLVFPGAAHVAKLAKDEFKNYRRKKDITKWERFNLWRLRSVLKRLHRQKLVKITENEDGAVVKLTEKGKTYFLKYQLENMIMEKPPKWDGRWHLIIYDIGVLHKDKQAAFRQTLNRLKFLRIQNSVYLYPYPCGREIEFLRRYYGIGDEVRVMTVLSIENESAYKRYFGLY